MSIFKSIKEKFFGAKPHPYGVMDGVPIPKKQKWKSFLQDPRVLVQRQSLIHPGSKIFCMGSCFAIEIKKALKSSGYQVRPYEYDLKVQLPNGDIRLASGRELVHYSVFTILQEFEKAFGLWEQDENDFWVVQKRKKPGVNVFRDPYRRETYSTSREGILRITRAFDEVIRKGILESDIYILTLGLTESWKKRDNGRYVCAGPGLAGAGWNEETDFVQTGFEENYKGLRRIVELIQSRFPERHVILTVSPVPMARTFAPSDVYTATTESKAILRAAAGQVAREMPRVHYFSAFEMCLALARFGKRKVYNIDGRHVMPEVVQCITGAFLDAYRA